MREHKQTKQIDDYLLNKLNKREKEEFEQHYFNCSVCFKKLKEREELISIIKNKHDLIFQNLNLKEKQKRKHFSKPPFSFLSPKLGITAAVFVALFFIIVIVFLPTLKTPPPQFRLDSNTVRGRSINIIPTTIPTHFKWENMGENIEYKVSIYNNQLFWEKTTKKNAITLPDEIKAQMAPGIIYFWQVKAYSPEGILTAKSPRIQIPPVNK